MNDRLQQYATQLANSVTATAATDLVTDPRNALEKHFGLKVTASAALVGAQTRGAHGQCDGLSFLNRGVILYAPSPFSRRENFTLIHELAHFLVSKNDAVLDWLADLTDGQLTEERLCDFVAQRLLLPEQLIDSVLAGAPPAAHHIMDLYEASAASEPVCAIALATRLPCQGAVFICDLGTRAVTSASIQALDEGWPAAAPWPGRPVPGGHPLRAMDPGSSSRRRSWWETPWGAKTPFYVDAVAGERRIHAVLAANDLWNAETLHLDSPIDVDSRLSGTVFCCGQTRNVRGFPCTTCKQYFCPKCGRCRCTKPTSTESTCSICNLVVAKHRMRGTVCEDCA